MIKKLIVVYAIAVAILAASLVVICIIEVLNGAVLQ